jgi:Transposase DDE domain
VAGLKGYTTNLTGASAEFVIDAYHQLWRIEKSFRMSKHDLQARPVYHHKRDSIEAHLSIVFAALSLSHWIERQTGWSIKKFVRTARRYRTVHPRGTTNSHRRRPLTREPPRRPRQNHLCRVAGGTRTLRLPQIPACATNGLDPVWRTQGQAACAV